LKVCDGTLGLIAGVAFDVAALFGVLVDGVVAARERPDRGAFLLGGNGPGC